MDRPDVDEYFMAMAFMAAERSTCLSRKVGAVMVKNKRVLSTGYNGAPKGLPHCEELGGCMRRGDIHPPYIDIFLEQYKDKENEDISKEEMREKMIENQDFFPEKGKGVKSGYRHELCRAVHAEQNAIIQAAVSGVSIKNATLYCTTYPCVVCAKMLINAEIEKIIYHGEYKDPLSQNLLEQSQIEVENYKRKSEQQLLNYYERYKEEKL